MVGYGLSYTKFDYSKLQVQASSDGGVDVSFRIRNVGPYTGSDTPQVYVGPSSQLSAGTQQAVRKLVQFQRVALTSGHAADLTLHVSAAIAVVVVDRAAEVGARNGRAVDLRRPVVAGAALAGDGDRRQLIGKGADDGGFRSPPSVVVGSLKRGGDRLPNGRRSRSAERAPRHEHRLRDGLRQRSLRVIGLGLADRSSRTR